MASVREGRLVATAQRKRTADPTFAGLAHLVAPAEELADLDCLTGAIDAAATEVGSAKTLHGNVVWLIGMVAE